MTARRLALLVALLWVSGDASAHPHLWIDTTVDLLLDDSGVHAAAVTWVFDDFNSSEMIFMFDTNLNGELSPDEVQRLQQESFSHLAQIDYFLLSYRGSEQLDIGGAQAFDASIDRGRMSFEFTVPIQVPWRRIADLVIMSFDGSYYIDFQTTPVRSRYVHDQHVLHVLNETVRLTTAGYGTVSVPAIRVERE
jgi:ABC-type uncharacterized transport system substrate-binding protein